MHPTLNFPLVQLRLKDDQVWDPLRRKFVKLTPEEWVRQHTIAYLTSHLGYSSGLMSSEHNVVYAGQKKRCDIVAFDSQMNALLLVECKAPEVPVQDQTLYQIAKYANVLRAKFLLLTNGLQHFCARIDAERGTLNFLREVPNRKEAESLTG